MKIIVTATTTTTTTTATNNIKKQTNYTTRILTATVGGFVVATFGEVLGQAFTETVKVQVATLSLLSTYFTVTSVLPTGNKLPLTWVVETREGLESQSSSAVVAHVAAPEPPHVTALIVWS